ncbi:N-acetyltransferase family protein [Luteolibacter sp. Populi]|uniref:GNAT family N-acetyltransferase n=1 Tax=Luteolibacter sp. Populi TaxID=3230487 RepID=UPI0034656F81
MPAAFEIRDAEPADHEIVFDLYEALFRHHVEQIWGWNQEWQIANFAEEWRRARTSVILVEGAIAGYLQVQLEEDHSYLLSLGILPASQGVGIGYRIMEDLMDETALRGLPLRLSVFRTNPRALRFYEALGFQVTEATPEFHRLEWQATASN